MAATNIRVKVPVPELVALVEKRRDRLEKNFAKEQADYAKKFEAWRDRARKYVEAAQPETVERHQFPYPPYRPHRPSELSKVEADLALLKRTSDTVLSISSSSNLYRYFEGE